MWRGLSRPRTNTASSSPGSATTIHTVPRCCRRIRGQVRGTGCSARVSVAPCPRGLVTYAVPPSWI